MITATVDESLAARAKSAGVLDFVVVDPALVFLSTLSERLSKAVGERTER
jgi:hypothetical protein